MQHLTKELFKEDPSYRDDVMLWESKTPIPCRIYEYTYRSAGTPQRQIQTLLENQIFVGDIFKIGDHEFWTCVESYCNHGSNWQGTLEYCNYILKFILDGTTFEVPVFMKNSTQYNSGETVKDQMTLGSSQHLIYLPYNKDNIKIKNGMRFLIDKNNVEPTAYKVSQVDPTSYSYGDHGLIQLTVMEDLFSPIRDNKDLMIADYYSNENDSEKWWE